MSLWAVLRRRTYVTAGQTQVVGRLTGLISCPFLFFFFSFFLPKYDFEALLTC